MRVKLRIAHVTSVANYVRGTFLRTRRFALPERDRPDALVANNVQVPEVVFAEPAGWDDLPPFAVLRWIHGTCSAI